MTNLLIKTIDRGPVERIETSQSLSEAVGLAGRNKKEMVRIHLCYGRILWSLIIIISFVEIPGCRALAKYLTEFKLQSMENSCPTPVVMIKHLRRAGTSG